MRSNFLRSSLVFAAAALLGACSAVVSAVDGLSRACSYARDRIASFCVRAVDAFKVEPSAVDLRTESPCVLPLTLAQFRAFVARLAQRARPGFASWSTPLAA